MSNASYFARGAYRKVPCRASGFMLLEVLISILLFALGFVALMGLQGRSLTATQDVEYRAEVVQLSNAYLAKMWAFHQETKDHTDPAATLQSRFGGNGTEFSAFKAQVEKLIPGAKSVTVTVVPTAADQTIRIAGGTETLSLYSVTATIKVEWADKEDPNITHNHTQQSSVGFQPLDPDITLNAI